MPMSRRLSLGRWLDIPVFLDSSWFVILALVAWTLATGYFPLRLPGVGQTTYWGMGVAAAVLLFCCVLLHELGHAVVAKAYGIPVSRVTLFIFGGVAHIAREPRRPWVELVVALAGPLVSIVIAAGCFWAATALPPEIGRIGPIIVRYLAVVNTAIVVFNLLPGFPLDGGRLLRAALWAWSGDLRRATRIAGMLGHGLGVALMGLGLLSLLRGQWINGVWYVLLGMFLRNAARVSVGEAVG